MFKSALFTLVALGALTLSSDHAFARRGGSDGASRVKTRIVLNELPGAPFDARQAVLRVERQKSDRQEIRIQAEDAPTGLDLRVFIADATGTLVEIASMSEDDPGEYRWRVRTKKGDALPFGQSDLAGLSGRAVEVRTGSGARVYATTFPTVAPASAPRLAKKGLRSALAVDTAALEALGLAGLQAKIKVRRRGADDEKLSIELAGAPAGSVFDVWMQDPLSGQMTLLATLGGTSAGKRGEDDDDDLDGDDDGDDGDDDDDGDGDDGEELEYEVETEDGETLPFGVTSVAALAGLDVEIRTTSGTVVATGEVPAVGEDTRGDDDDHDGDEDGTDDGDDDDGSSDD